MKLIALIIISLVMAVRLFILIFSFIFLLWYESCLAVAHTLCFIIICLIVQTQVFLTSFRPDCQINRTNRRDPTVISWNTNDNIQINPKVNQTLISFSSHWQRSLLWAV